MPQVDHGVTEADLEALWRVPLERRDRWVLEWAFARDPELHSDVGLVFGGLVELGVHGIFVREFVSRVRTSGPWAPPALSVLPAASAAIEAVTWPR